MRVILLTLFSTASMGADLSVTWQHPTERVDNSPLALIEILKTEIACHRYFEGEVEKPCPFTTIAVNAPATAKIISVTIPSVGARIGITAKTYTKDNLISEPTEVVWKTWPAVDAPPPPKPPIIDLTVTP
jgi:hypothetical protein